MIQGIVAATVHTLNPKLGQRRINQLKFKSQLVVANKINKQRHMDIIYLADAKVKKPGTVLRAPGVKRTVFYSPGANC
jgi:hypothetical protein